MAFRISKNVCTLNFGTGHFRVWKWLSEFPNMSAHWIGTGHFWTGIQKMSLCPCWFSDFSEVAQCENWYGCFSDLSKKCFWCFWNFWKREPLPPMDRYEVASINSLLPLQVKVLLLNISCPWLATLWDPLWRLACLIPFSTDLQVWISCVCVSCGFEFVWVLGVDFVKICDHLIHPQDILASSLTLRGWELLDD